MVFKLDVKSMYPTIIHDFNLHALTTRITAWTPLHKSEVSIMDTNTGKYIQIGKAPCAVIRKTDSGQRFVNDAYAEPWLNRERLDEWRDRMFSRHDNGLDMELHDDRYMHCISTKTIYTRESKYRVEIRNLKRTRERIQEENDEIKAKDPKDPRIEQLRSMEYSLKVVMNKKFGYNGARESVYGDLGVAVCIVNIASLIVRYIIQIGRDDLGLTPIEVDTDGIIFHCDSRNARDRSVSYITDKLRGIFSPYCYENESTIRITMDKYSAIYMYSTKNYAIMDENGRITLHGVAYKSSRYSRVFSDAVRQAAKHVLRGHIGGFAYGTPKFTTTLRKMLVDKMSQLPLSAFQMSINLRKDPQEYDAGKQERRLAKQVESDTQRKIRAGDQIFFFYTGDHAAVPVSTMRNYGNKQAMAMLDTAYYISEIDKALSRFGLDYKSAAQLSLFM